MVFSEGDKSIDLRVGKKWRSFKSQTLAEGDTGIFINIGGKKIVLKAATLDEGTKVNLIKHQGKYWAIKPVGGGGSLFGLYNIATSPIYATTVEGGTTYYDCPYDPQLVKYGAEWFLIGGQYRTTRNFVVWSSPDLITWTKIKDSGSEYGMRGHRCSVSNGYIWLIGGYYPPQWDYPTYSYLGVPGAEPAYGENFWDAGGGLTLPWFPLGYNVSYWPYFDYSLKYGTGGGMPGPDARIRGSTDGITWTTFKTADYGGSYGRRWDHAQFVRAGPYGEEIVLIGGLTDLQYRWSHGLTPHYHYYVQHWTGIHAYIPTLNSIYTITNVPSFDAHDPNGGLRRPGICFDGTYYWLAGGSRVALSAADGNGQDGFEPVHNYLFRSTDLSWGYDQTPSDFQITSQPANMRQGYPSLLRFDSNTFQTEGVRAGLTVGQTTITCYNQGAAKIFAERQASAEAIDTEYDGTLAVGSVDRCTIGVGYTWPVNIARPVESWVDTDKVVFYGHTVQAATTPAYIIGMGVHAQGTGHTHD